MPLPQQRTGRRRVVSEHPPERLDSWKDIAAYLKRDVSTVQRWEKREGMPVHRHQHDKLGSVYAFPSEIDAWVRGRSVAEGESEETDGSLVPPPQATQRRVWIGVAAAAAVAIALAAVAFLKRPEPNPLADARFVRLTDFEGTEQAAAISRDGRFVAFLSDREGPLDVWVTQIGTGQFHNLTRGRLHELLNPDIRMLGFSPDGALVSIWVRRMNASGKPEISVWAIPTLGGEPRLYVEGAAELAWSNDGTRLVYHTPASGDPMFVRAQDGTAERKIFTGPPGVHNHYPVWSPDDRFIYFVLGSVPSENDVWRIDATGGSPERMTSHNTRVTDLAFLDRRTLLYLATDADGGGPWLYALDVARRRSRRVGFGVERYASLDASADGRRLVVAVANRRRTLWRVPIAGKAAGAKDATRIPVPIVGGRAPRLGPGFLLYVSSRSEGDSIWKLSGGTSSELWNIGRGRVIGRPAIAPDGKRIAFTTEDRGRTRLFVMSSDGSGLRGMPESLQPRGTPAWSPDGRSIAIVAAIDGAPRLVRVSLEPLTVTPLGSGFAADPVWSPDGASIVFSGPEVGTTFPIRAVGTDGRTRPAPNLMLSRGVRHVAFLPGQNAIVVLRGEMVHKNFWAIDLDTGAERRLTDFGPEVIIGDFDLTPDGREIVFDREQAEADLVLVERTGG
jgi:Tol biopolymer transport system component